MTRVPEVVIPAIDSVYQGTFYNQSNRIPDFDKNKYPIKKQVASFMFNQKLSASLFITMMLQLGSGQADDNQPEHSASFVSQSAHSFLANTQWMIMPLLNGLVGNVATSGEDSPISVASGMMIGTAMGGLDELYNHLTGQSSYYLSSGLIGAAATSNLPLPNKMNYLCGFIAGLLTASGQLNNLSQYASAPTSGAISGAILGGAPGAALGAAAGLTDEAMAACNLTDTKPLSTALTAITQLRIFAPVISNAAGQLSVISPGYKQAIQQLTIPYLLESAGTVWGGLCTLAYDENSAWSYLCLTLKPSERENGKTDLELVQGVDNSLSQIMDTRFVEKIARIQLLTTVGSTLIGSRLSQALSRRFQNIDTGLVLFDSENSEQLQTAFHGFSQASLQLGLFCIPYFAHRLTDTVLSDYYSWLISRTAQSELDRLYYDDDAFVRLNLNQSLHHLITNMHKNTAGIVSKGADLKASFAEAYIGGFYDLSYIFKNNAADMVVFLNIYNSATKSITVALNNAQIDAELRKEELDTQLDMRKKDLSNNARTVGNTLKKEFMVAKYQQSLHLQQSAASRAHLASTISDNWGIFKDYVDYAAKNLFIAHKLFTKDIEFANYGPLLAAGNSVSKGYSWYSSNAPDIREFAKSKTGFDTLVNEIRNNPDKHLPSASYMAKPGGSIALQFDDFSVGHTNTTLVQSASITLPSGYYAVTGPSGSGKSSFLSKVRRETGNGIWSSGFLTYTTADGELPTVFNAEQLIHIPAESTLRELITLETQFAFESGQSRLPAATDDYLLKLLQEINFVAGQNTDAIHHLNEVKNWHELLSGGQLKKLTLLSAIVRQPSIAILDEIFTGLDEGSLNKAQRMIRQYLPDALILIVDHHAKTNHHNAINGLSFYDGELHLEDRQLLLRTMD